MHYACMAIQLTIRDISDDVRDELASRAARRGQSMQEYLRLELEQLARRPTLDAWLEQVRRRKRASGSRIEPRAIVRHRDADRR